MEENKEKQEKLNKLQRESAIKNSLANLLKDVLSISIQLKANAETIEDNPELLNICNKHIQGVDELVKDIAAYLAK